MYKPDESAADHLGEAADDLMQLLYRWSADPYSGVPELTPNRPEAEPTAYRLVQQAVIQLLTALGARDTAVALDHMGDGSNAVEAVELSNESA